MRPCKSCDDVSHIAWTEPPVMLQAPFRAGSAEAFLVFACYSKCSAYKQYLLCRVFRAALVSYVMLMLLPLQICRDLRVLEGNSKHQNTLSKVPPSSVNPMKECWPR